MTALLLVAALAGCGGDGGGGGGITPPPPPANPNTVSIRDNFFNPQNRTVAVGTTVTWVNDGNAVHNTRSTTQVWSSDDIAPDGSFQFTFGSAGTFPYQCTLHPGMNGTITVQ